MLHMDARFENHQTSGSEEDVVFIIYGSGGHVAC